MPFRGSGHDSQVEKRFCGAAQSIFLLRFLLCFLAARAQELPSVPHTSTLLFSVQNSGATGVQDVKAEEFTLLDNGSAAKITTLESAESVPIRLAILLYSNGATFKTQQQAAVQIIEKLRPGLDQAFVLTQAATNNSSAWPDESQARAWPTDQVVLEFQSVVLNGVYPEFTVGFCAHKDPRNRAEDVCAGSRETVSPSSDFVS
jgi:hypothetical protein